MRNRAERAPPAALEEPLPQKLLQVRQVVNSLEELEKKLPEPWLPFQDPKVAEDMRDVHYLDAEKTVCLVSRPYLCGLVESLNRLRFAHAEQLHSLKQSQVEVEKLRRESSLKGDYARELADKLAEAERINSELVDRVVALSEEVNKSTARVQQIYQRERPPRLPALSAESAPPQLLSASAQTEYWSPRLELVVQESPAQVPRTPATEAAERMAELIGEYEEKLELMSRSLAQKLQGVTDNVFDVKEWLRRNLELHQENQRLRAEMQRFELEKEKARIWQQEVASKMKSLEDEVCAPLPLPLVSDITVHEPPGPDEIQVKVENEYLREEISNLRQQVLDRQLQMSLMAVPQQAVDKEAVQKAKRVLRDHMEEDMEEEGLVGKAVALSGKFRALTEFLYDVV